MKSFMRQTKSGLKELINSFGVARGSFRRADELLSALFSQLNGLRLLDEFPKRKKASGGRLPNAPQMINRTLQLISSQSQQIRICF